MKPSVGFQWSTYFVSQSSVSAAHLSTRVYVVSQLHAERKKKSVERREVMVGSSQGDPVSRQRGAISMIICCRNPGQVGVGITFNGAETHYPREDQLTGKSVSAAPARKDLRTKLRAL